MRRISRLKTAVAAVVLVAVLSIVSFARSETENDREQLGHRRLGAYNDPKSVQFKTTPLREPEQEVQVEADADLKARSRDRIKNRQNDENLFQDQYPTPQDGEAAETTTADEIPQRPSDTSLPSHVQLCQELIQRREMPGPYPPFVVTENPAVCQSDESYGAMVHIMTSALIAQAGSRARLVYEHKCHDTVQENKPLTIQQMLPNDLTYAVGIGIIPISEKCAKCVPQYLNDGRHMVECMGFPSPGQLPEPVDPMLASFRISGFRHNIQKAEQRFKTLEMEQGGGKTRPTGGATVLLDLESEISGDAWMMPLYYYKQIIQEDVPSIVILVTQRCVGFSPLCKDHAMELASQLQEAYPRAVVRGEITRGSAMAYSRVMESPVLICPPTMFCLLPSLFNEYSSKSYLIMKAKLYPWYFYLARENRKLMHKTIELADETKTLTKVLTDKEDMQNFLSRHEPKMRRRLTQRPDDGPEEPPAYPNHRRLTFSDPKTVVYKSRIYATTEQASSKNVDDYSRSSFMELCDEVRSRYQHRRTAPEKLQDLYVVQERAEVCHSQDSYTSLTTIMLSAFVAQAASALRVAYRHNCRLGHQPDIRQATIQQVLPQMLTVASGLGLEEVHKKCGECLGNHEWRNHIECMGLPTLGQLPKMVDPLLASKKVAAFRHNIEMAASHVKLLEREDRPPTNAGAIIYIDTQTETGSGETYAVPMRYYAEIIPRDVSSIAIIVNARVQNHDEYSDFMRRYLHMMYPRANIKVELVASSAIAYSRVMEAPILICSPGTFCLLPSLFMEYSHSSHLTASQTLYPWFYYLARENRKLMGKTIQLQSDISVQPISSLQEMQPFLFEAAPPHSDECTFLRGRLGEWIYDAEYAKVAQYETPLKRFREFPDFVSTKEQPYRSSTSYRWVDALCPVDLVYKDGMCFAMEELGLTRIYIIGDSLSMQMAQSLWKLLGHEDDPVIRSDKGDWKQSQRFHFERHVDCGKKKKGFDLVYTRNDFIDNNDQEHSFEKIGTEFNCGIAEYCMPWLKSYADSKHVGGTLLVANLGPHVHDLDTFHRYFNDFLNLMSEHQRKNDVVMVRTTVPGHEGCQAEGVVPLTNYDEFAETLIADYKSWHLFGAYNDMQETMVRMHNSANDHKIEILDVNPMTVLRPDGHISSSPVCSTCRQDDCFHYALPGPLDWWNHLMYSNLVNLMQLKLEQEAARKAGK